jgi:pyruvate,water dikinase
MVNKKGEDKMAEQRVTIWDGAPGFDFIEEIDLPAMHSWFFDGTHSVPPWTHLYGWFWCNYCPNLCKPINAKLNVPTCKGWEMRFKDGGSYNAFHIVRDKNEIAERAKKYRVAIKPFLEDFSGIWNAGRKSLLDTYSKLRELDVDKANYHQLFHHHHDLIDAFIQMWEVHHECLFSSHSAYLLFTDLCRENFGMSDQDPAFQNMLRGFTNKVYEMDKDLWEFGRLAVDLGLKDTFLNNAPEAIIGKLEREAKGKDWLGHFMRYLNTDEVGGWRMRRANDFNEPYWLEDLPTPIGVVKNFIAVMAKGGSYGLESTRAELAKLREEAIAAFLNKVPAQDRDLYEALARLSGQISSFSEEHDLYCELMVQALMRRGYLAMGRRIAEVGSLDTPEDIFFLNADEIDRVILVPDRIDMRWVARRRKDEWKGWFTKQRAPIITERASIEEAIMKDLLESGDSIAIKVVVGEPPQPKPGIKADLWGLCGCAGEVEGVARVVTSYEGLKDVQPGEILVCANTNPAWTPVFGIIKAVVADSGGTLAHTAIIGREYNIPTIVNTMKGTQVIKTGQRIKIDAANGAVFILDK